LWKPDCSRRTPAVCCRPGNLLIKRSPIGRGGGQAQYRNDSSAALLAPESIPLFLFAEAREKFGDPVAGTLDGDGLDEAVAALRAFALVDRDKIMDERYASITTDAIRLHRLVREIAAARREGEARDTLRQALVAASAISVSQVARRCGVSSPQRGQEAGFSKPSFG
jgi:hypothetical protein